MLVADDNILNQRILAKMFESLGCRNVRFVFNGSVSLFIHAILMVLCVSSGVCESVIISPRSFEHWLRLTV